MVEQYLKELQDFMKSDRTLCLLNGNKGSGKTFVLNRFFGGIEYPSLKFRFNCFASSNLDDLLLNLFMDFKRYQKARGLALPSARGSVQENINLFIKTLHKPITIMIDSFDQSANQFEILDFVQHCLLFDNVKILICTRNASLEKFKEFFESQKDKLQKITLTKMTDDDFYEYLFDEGVDEDDEVLNKLKRASNSEFFQIQLAVKMLKIQNISLKEFLLEYTNNPLSFEKFLLNKLIFSLEDKYLKLVWFLAVARVGFSKEYLLNSNLYVGIEIDCPVIFFEDNLFYVKDYFKENLLNLITYDSSKKINDYLVGFYEAQLTKKPAERAVMISRATMRKEIEYHRNFLEALKIKHQSQETNLSYVSYAKGANLDWVLEELSKPEKPKPKELEEVQVEANFGLNEKNTYELSEEEIALLNSTQEEAPEERVETNEIESINFTEKTLNDYITLANKSESSFNFDDAIINYNNALTMEADSLYEVKKPLILTKLAICYKNLNDFDSALRFFSEVDKIYENDGEIVKSNYIKLNIAQLYAKFYKLIKSKEIYENILKSEKTNPNHLNSTTYLALGDIENSLSNVDSAQKFYVNALKYLTNVDEEPFKAEVYFKYALALDDKMETDEAVANYEHCIEACSDKSANNYLALAYTNLATIYQEKNESQKALEYYHLALESDKAHKNFEGLYFIYSKLAALYRSRNEEKALRMFANALKSAKKLEDKFYTMSAFIDLGDFYYDKKEDEKALKNYLEGFETVKNSDDKMDLANKENIRNRIYDLKVRMDGSVFRKYESEYGFK